MARSRFVVGVDLGTETIKAVLLELVRGEDQPRVVGAAAAHTRGMRKGVILEPSEVAASLRETLDALQKSTDYKHASYFVGMGGIGLGYQKSRGLVAISRADGEVSPEDAKRAISASESNLARIQNRELLHRIPLWYRVDNDTTVYDPVGLSGIKLEAEVLFVTAFSHHTKAVLKTLDEAKVDAEDIAAGPYALSHAVLQKREKEVGVIVLDIGASTTSIIIFEERLPYSLEIIPWGAAHITNDIAMGFQISIEEAEKLKIQYGAVSNSHSARSTSSKKEDAIYGNYSKRKLAEIIEARLGDIFELVEKHLKKVDRVGLLPAGVVIVGGGANIEGIADFAREALKLPSRVVIPEEIGGFKDKVHNPAWASAVGVALMGLERREGAARFKTGSSTFLRWLRAFLP